MRAWPGYVPYSASKAAVISLTQGFAKTLAPEVTVNAIAPGPMLPPAGATKEQGEAAVATTLLKRWGDPQDIADAVVYLAGAPYVTGVVLPVDGGRSIV
jgi:NAD(P)-dependent dehydrogenase (short-subunit alcohol dehydrogenase family)